MESLSRPPHRRKHSTTTNAFSSSSFSLKNPYDDIVFSNGGGKAKLGVHEYAEIFSGSSSIPVLDLSGLDEGVWSGDSRSSKLDYSNIFGGLRDDDMGVPYEKLFNGAARKKTNKQIPVDAKSPSQESGSLHSPGKTKQTSGEALEQSTDGVKQHINMSFNKTSQRNIDASNGKTHIAQLHAVPGFTYFADGTPRSQKTEVGGPLSSLKREVSRTWSFSAGVEAVTVNGRSSLEKSHVPDKSRNGNEFYLKSRISKEPPPPSNVTDNKDPLRSKLPSFASKDASGRTAGECSPPFFDEELDENSVAAVSAAALKKAIEQAQESIRLAKMIMERKKESFQDGTEHRSKSCMKVKEKREGRIDHEAGGSKEIDEGETYRTIDPKFPIFTGVDEKFAPFLSHKEKLVNAGNSEVERVRENVEAAMEHIGVFTEAAKKLNSSCSQSETIHIAGKVELENVGQNVEAAEVCMAERVEQKKESIHQSQGPEVVAEVAVRAPNTSQSAQVLDKGVDEAMEWCQAFVDHIKGPENIVELLEKVSNCSESRQEQEKIVCEAGENLTISQEDNVIEERNNVADNMGKHNEKFVEHHDIVYGEHSTVLKSEFDNLQNESQTQAEKEVLEQEDMEKKSENVPNWKEIGDMHGKSRDEEGNGMSHEEAHQWFEAEQRLKEPLEEEMSVREPEILTEVEEVGIKLNLVHEPDIDNEKLDYGHNADGQKIHREFEQNENAERHIAEIVKMEADNRAEEASCNAEETNDTLREESISEENQEKFDFQEAASENDINDAVDVHRNDTSTVFSEAEEPSDDLNNKTEEYQDVFKGHKENDSLAGETETFSTVEEEALKQFHLEVDKMPETDSLHRSASEGNFIGSKLNNAFEGLSSDSNSGDIDADYEELPKDKDTFETASEVQAAAGEYDAKINMQTSPEADPSDHKAAECDHTNLWPVFERTSERNDGSESTSVLENMDGVSALESEGCAEETGKDETSNKDKVKDDLDVTSGGREYVKEQNEQVYSEDRNEQVYPHPHLQSKETDNMETEREVETGQNTKNDKEDLNRTSTVEQKDTKGYEQKFETNDQQQRIEAIKRGREREKDRMAVERAIREARERAFAEARERADRAAVERAAAEARQRVMAEARLKPEKASSEAKQPADKASTEAKLRAERAAVERATAEARERAFEKAKSQKTFTETKTQTERNSGLKHSFSSSDLDKFNGTISESAQRRKARLERHQRIMERAAKALAEKNMRDLLAQKEQAERNRLAESLDADIKRWATGKEGNLRALLSTLQYILGPESGWQPVSLTEIITTAAVKKAYRKATLCVHPDKLQQRGASIQQKYICEKVFDLLKAAWNRFNSEER